jgi:hypothetical protein
MQARGTFDRYLRVQVLLFVRPLYCQHPGDDLTKRISLLQKQTPAPRQNDGNVGDHIHTYVRHSSDENNIPERDRFEEETFYLFIYFEMEVEKTFILTFKFFH